MDDATVALRVTRRLEPAARDNFGMFTSDTLLGIYAQASQRHLRDAASAWWRCRWWSAAS